jgi:hypothetical protein
MSIFVICSIADMAPCLSSVAESDRAVLGSEHGRGRDIRIARSTVE